MLRVTLPVLVLGLFLSSHSHANQERCSRATSRAELTACDAVVKISGQFFELLRRKMPEKARNEALHALYRTYFARMKIARTLVVKIHGRGMWESVTPPVREQIAFLGGQFVLKQIIYGRFGKAARDSNEITVTVTRVEVRPHNVIVYSTVRGRQVVKVRWYLTRDLKVFNIYLSAPFPSFMLNTYTNHIARLANGHDQFILYKMKSSYPGEAIIRMLQDLIKGEVLIDPRPGQFR